MPSRHTPRARSSAAGIPRDGSGDLDTPLPLLIVAMLLAILPIIAASQFAAYLRFDVVDDQMFGYFGWRIANGGTVYLDVWDNKPPGVYWINALGFLVGRDSYAGVIAICALTLVLIHVLFFCICASVYFRGAAALTTILASFFLTHGYYQGGTNRTETYLVCFDLAAVLLYMRGHAHDRNWKWLVVGLLAGAAFLFKQVGLASLAAMGLHTLFLSASGVVPLTVAIRRGALMLGGAAVAVAAAAGVLAAQGALADALVAVFSFNRAYFAVQNYSLTDTWVNRRMLVDHMLPYLRAPVLMAIAALVHAFLWWLRPALRPAEIEQPLRAYRPVCPHYMVLFALWYVIAFYGASISPHHFRHYLVPTLPPLLLMCGYLINVIKTEVSLVTRMQQRAWVVAALVLVAWLAVDSFKVHAGEVSRVWVDRFERHKQADWEKIAAVVRRYAGPTDRIHCWGYFPGVYLHAKRLNASRFITTEKIGQVGEYADFIWDGLRTDLETNRPAVFVVSDEDYNWLSDPSADRRLPMRYRPGQRAKTSPDNRARGEFEENVSAFLRYWVNEYYERVDDVSCEQGVVYVYRRRDLAPAAAAAESGP